MHINMTPKISWHVTVSCTRRSFSRLFLWRSFDGGFRGVSSDSPPKPKTHLRWSVKDQGSECPSETLPWGMRISFSKTIKVNYIRQILSGECHSLLLIQKDGKKCCLRATKKCKQMLLWAPWTISAPSQPRVKRFQEGWCKAEGRITGALTLRPLGFKS